MNIEKLKLNVTLKCGEKVFFPGEFLAPNIPRELINEVRSGAKTVTVIAPVSAQRAHENAHALLEKEKADFTKSWIDLDANTFSEFLKVEENRLRVVQTGQLDRARAKWFRFFPTDPFPGEEKKEEPTATASVVEKKAEDEKPKKTERILRTRK